MNDFVQYVISALSLGGLYVFGATGVVLGPVVLALSLGLLDVWRRHLTRA